MKQMNLLCWLFIVVFLPLTSCNDYNISEVKNGRHQIENEFVITPTCMGGICLGGNLNELNKKGIIRSRVDEFQYSYSSQIDSVLYSEWMIDDEIIAYTRNSIFDINDSTIIKMVLTKSNRLETPNGVKVGMTFNELKNKIPNASFSRKRHEKLGSGQYRQRLNLDEGNVSLIVIDYEEKNDNNIIDTIVTSIGLFLDK